MNYIQTKKKQNKTKTKSKKEYEVAIRIKNAEQIKNLNNTKDIK